MEKVKIEIPHPVQRAIEEIITVYIQLAGVENGKKISSKFYSSLDQLAQYPLLGTMFTDKKLQLAGYLFLILDKYLCIYRFIENVVYIYHVVHGATDYPRIFKASQQNYST